MHYLYREGNGNEGNYPRCIIELKPTDSPYAAAAALVANRYIAGSRTRRHIMRNVQTDGEAEFGVMATVYEGPNGEMAFESAWITAELQPLTPEDLAYYRGQGMREDTIRSALDRAALAMFRKQNKA